MFNDEEWKGSDADEAYWAMMPSETPGDPSLADLIIQDLLDARLDIKLEGYGSRNDNDYCNGYLAGRFQSIDLSLRIVLRRLDVSPRQRYIAEHVLGQTATP
ncbi:hypothetical protein ACET98_11030 [Aeromonas veronii]|uniref:hypothetical protein n=1 Tax=Aeromonas veronii TaxID=654 RepID=UPI0012F6EA77|nr:hypothetical protein [Aeromonas veronii]QGW99228.1 hypothetical protein FGM04_22120 [Aeromonas veronii]